MALVTLLVLYRRGLAWNFLICKKSQHVRSCSLVLCSIKVIESLLDEHSVRNRMFVNVTSTSSYLPLQPLLHICCKNELLEFQTKIVQT